jgi:DNA mismatch endonuclease (patch repair protein)
MDRLTHEQRHKNMQSVKNKNSDIEKLLRKELWHRGIHYRKNVKTVYGHPDLAFKGKKVAVFCDGEFWHGFDWANRKNDIKTRQKFWISKIERNIERDKEVTNYLQQEGWIVIRFWGKQIKKDVSGCADIVQQALEKRR